MTDGHRYGVDHGLSFNVDHKLRTVLWGWAGEPLDDEDVAGLRALADLICTKDSELSLLFGQLIMTEEVAATLARCERLLSRNRMPVPSGRRPSIPWPAF
jgi:uncharacterized repeat protein (TIGR03843 family)